MIITTATGIKRRNGFAAAVFIAVMLSSFTAEAKNYTYVTGQSRGIKNYSGPNAKNVWNLSRIMAKTVAYHDESGLRQIVSYDWGGMDTSDGGGAIYCNSSETFDAPLVIRRGYGNPVGRTPDGHAMWNTNIKGLYFAVEFTAMYTANSTITAPHFPFWLDNTETEVHITPTGDAYTSCTAATRDQYIETGGIVFSTHVHLYADETFTPSRSTTISDVDLIKPENFDFKFYNPTSGLPNNYSIEFNFITEGFNAVWPTCGASTVSGSKVSSGTSTLNFGTFYPAQVSGNGVGPEEFQINLSNCSYIENIEVKLASTAIGSNKTLLSNTLTGSSAASGIGVEIKGKQTSLSPEMILIPGDSNSVYKFTPYPAGTAYVDSDNKYATSTLNFLATLKQDNNKTITPGNFKATGTFQLSYP